MTTTDQRSPPHRYQLKYTGWWMTGGVALVALVIYGSLTSGGPDIPVRNFDKAIHLVAYSILMTWFGGLFKRRAQWLILIALIALGVALEFLQGWGGQRQFETADMVMNGVGVLLGRMLCRFGLEGWCQNARTYFQQDRHLKQST